MAELFRNLQPLYNPIGFGASDFIVLAWVALLVLLLVCAQRLQARAAEFAARTGWCMLAIALLPVLLRLALLPSAPVPVAHTPDDFSYLLLGDTLAHFRLANPAHTMRRFFETNFVLQEPSYSSVYPLGQGIALAFGQVVFHQPWAGVLASTGLFCGLCYWMLRGWSSPGWSLLGGLLAVVQFGPLQYWMNTYWGGAVAGIAGCLIFGALGRLRQGARHRHAALLGLGCGISWLSRPYETTILLVCVLLALMAWGFRSRGRAPATVAGIAVLSVFPAIGLSLLQNRAVTGSWKTLPYMQSRQQYGVPTSFTWQPLPKPNRVLTEEQKVDYEMQAAVHGPSTDSWGSFGRRLAGRVRYLRFFFPVPLLLVAPVYFVSLRKREHLWVLGWLALVALGTNLYPYFYPHYVAGVACLLLLVAVTALERLYRWNQEATRLILMFCGAQFLFWYGLNVAAGWGPAMVLVDRYESWDFVDRGDPEGRRAMERRLRDAPGKQLVFVRYQPWHPLDQWMFNNADIDRSPVVRALDLGPEQNRILRRYYSGRTSWLLEPDAFPPRLSLYEEPQPPAAPVSGAPSKSPRNQSPFEEVPRLPR